MRVQSILTYTLPATGAYATVPPAAPFSCGCNDLVLILKSQSLLLTALKGVLRTEIKSVAVSSTPVASIDGSGALVWKYDYTVEYDAAQLTDSAYRVRKCDVEFNCCFSCAMAYGDRQLLGYVKTVTGEGVNNADPQNPVVASDSLVSNGNRSFTHTDAAGNEIIFCQGLQVIDHTDDNTGGIGAGYMIRGATFPDACTLLLDGAPEHTCLDGTLGGILTTPAFITPGDGVIITGPIPGEHSTTIINTTQRPLRVFLELTASVDFALHGVASTIVYSIELSVAGGAFNGQVVNRAGISGMPSGSLVINSETLSSPVAAIATVAPGASLAFAGRLNIQATAGIVDLSTHNLFLSWFGITL